MLVMFGEKNDAHMMQELQENHTQSEINLRASSCGSGSLQTVLGHNIKENMNRVIYWDILEGI